jgi:hypothetical protein
MPITYSLKGKENEMEANLWAAERLSQAMQNGWRFAAAKKIKKTTHRH